MNRTKDLKDEGCDKQRLRIEFIERTIIAGMIHLLTRTLDMSVKNIYGSLLDHEAILEMETEIPELVSIEGVNTDAGHVCSHNHSMTPLHRAVRTGCIELVQLLIDRGTNIHVEDIAGRVPIYEAINCESIELFNLLLDAGTDVNTKDRDNVSLLHWAVRIVETEFIEQLLNRGANICAKDNLGRTPLHEAAYRGEIKVVELLVNRGADVNAKCINGRTPLYDALYENNIEIVQLLLNRGAKTNIKDSNGITPLHVAVASNVKIVRMLLDADISGQCEIHPTLLHFAIHADQMEIIRLLLYEGADININNEDGITPLCYAIRRIHEKHSKYTILDDYVIDIVEPIKKYVIMMRAVGFYVNDENLRLIRGDSDFQNKCEAEVKLLKDEKINNTTISVYDILVKDINQIKMYSKNENLVQFLESNYFKLNFRIYGDVISYRFERAKKRRELMESSTRILDSIFSRILPYLCTEKIYSYLNNEDLRIILNASLNDVSDAPKKKNTCGTYKSS